MVNIEKMVLLWQLLAVNANLRHHGGKVYRGDMHSIWDLKHLCKQHDDLTAKLRAE